jgi:hypothetical protein
VQCTDLRDSADSELADSFSIDAWPGWGRAFSPIRTVEPDGASVLGLLSWFRTDIRFCSPWAPWAARDVKLMAGVGAWVGPGPFIVVFTP